MREGIGVLDGITVPGKGVQVGVLLGVGVMDGISVDVGEDVGGIVCVGDRVKEGVGVKVNVGFGGFPVTMKKSIVLLVKKGDSLFL